MGKTLNSNQILAGHITRALNKIRKPSTAEEITDLLNSEATTPSAQLATGSGNAVGESDRRAKATSGSGASLRPRSTVCFR